ncbi:MAG TPA: prolipoprotein diacylglyceryl transferase [Gammaproteobacteria bacterium]|nr:prolipoprotein diacylglyceryl transferase [Gammaproteobacteria bacterium]
MFTYPDIDPVLISIGPIRIHWYGLMYLVGIIGGWWLLRRRIRIGRHAAWTEEQLLDFIVAVALGLMIGGRLGSVLFYNFDSFLRDPLMLLRVWEGGMSFHGGLLGVLAAVWWFTRRTGHRFLPLMDMIAPVVPIGLGAGRIGNFINAELWGKPTDVPWAVVYQGVPRHASQLYEFLLEGVVLFIVLYTLSRKPRPEGLISGLFALLYGTFRFAVEFVRLPDAHIGYLAWGWLTMGQLLSLPLIIVGIWLILRSRNKALT